MKVRELYSFLNERIPSALSCEWDNDGLMCCPDANAEVHRVLVALDVTGRVIEQAVSGGYDVIVSHHPMIFSPLKRVEESDPVARKVIRLMRTGISVMSFHTRLDAVCGGVNDTLALALGLCDAAPFGMCGEEIGRIGSLSSAMSLLELAQLVKRVTGADAVQISDAGRPVCRLAILGGSGSDDVGAAIAAGADTYLTGELKHHNLTDAPDLGINLIAAGHFYTEHPVCRTLADWVREADADLTVDVIDSNPVQTV